MIMALIETKWDGLSQKVTGWWQKHRNDQLIQVNGVRERSISILQNRYGYTKEQAAAELDRHYSKAWLG